MNVMDLLHELEEELTDKRFGKKDPSRCIAIVEQMKEMLPAALDESDYIIQKQRQILKNADIVAKNTLKAAEEKADHLVGTTDILRKAEDEAKKMLDKTAGRCDLLVKKTKEHLDVMFVETEQFLLSSLNMIRTNRAELRDAMLIKIRD
ncbi:MAG: hypothetical protein FWE84_06250 [Firmicutes bacterium]|nr:hypothetical protein [Bacillota bacterium]